VLALGAADLFGAPTHRALAYPLLATGTVPVAWSSYDKTDVRTLISTGDTCPDRTFSLLAVQQKKGWAWVMDGGSVRYHGTKPDSMGWGNQVPILSRNRDYGKVAALISDNDVSDNDFECPMVPNFVQHNNGMVFTIDPRVAKLLATTGGVKVVTLGSNHITDARQSGILQTIAYLDAAGIAHTGAGKNLAAALAPAVVDVRGVKFAFVGWDDITGSAAATDTRPGVAPLTDDNACNSIKAARKVADIVIAMPQWGWPEYHATMTKTQSAQRDLFYKCGADGILGSGTHWASWASILPGPNGPEFAIGSHGNFLFDQGWSRQTMEGVIVEATFYGKKLVQFRLHPYVIVQGAQPNLVDPTTDGAFVLNQVWSVSDVR
jgi:poly-gamma-glutamate synthesis protein (capsule biosynthesis protein)